MIGGRVERRDLALVSLVAVAVLAMAPTSSGASPGTTTRVSVASGGTQADGPSTAPAVSADGRFVAFASPATNLVGGDTNGAADVFLRDVEAGTTTRVSVAGGGTQADAAASAPAISVDGRFVAFVSSATNLVGGDTNGAADVFVHDVLAATTTRVSVASGGAQADGPSTAPAVSGDGRLVAFASTATNLVGGDTNGVADVFVHDVLAATTTRVSVASAGAQADAAASAPAISVDGRFVAFESPATNLVAGDTNGVADVFVHERPVATTSLVSVATGGGRGDRASAAPAFSSDGRFVAFDSGATNLVADDTNGVDDVFLHDRLGATTSRVSLASGGGQGDARSHAASVSADGRFVAFESAATTLAPGDANGVADVFVRDRQEGLTTVESVDSAGAPANGPSGAAVIGAGARSVAFRSDASNLVTGDTNGAGDVFLHALAAPPPPTTTTTSTTTPASTTTTEPPVTTTTTAPPSVGPACDPSYPDVCIAPPPPDLECTDIPIRNFRVVTPPSPAVRDPHGFDDDNDGIGCEAGGGGPGVPGAPTEPPGGGLPRTGLPLMKGLSGMLAVTVGARLVRHSQWSRPVSTPGWARPRRRAPGGPARP